MTVKKSDFEVMEALTLDSMSTAGSQNSNSNKQKRKILGISISFSFINYTYIIETRPEMARSPPGQYDRAWPPTNREEFSPTDKPPFLPPHLLNIILNQDTAPHVCTVLLI